jgi:Pvc16 N-terminal domain
MSDYSVLSAVSSTLLTLLTNNITNALSVPLNVPIQLFSPPEMASIGQVPGISLWLYKVTRMPEMLNDPPERRSPTQIARTPLPVLLHYLVTPMANDPLTRQTLLGRVLQVFNDHAILRGADLQGVLQNTSEQLRINLEALTLEELSLVWEALGEPYQLSVTYLVQLARIDSDLELVKSGTVLEKQTSYSQILSMT